jgi:hypothetical protein
VVGVFESLDQASDAVTRLGEAGFPMDRVSIVGQNLQSELKMHGFVTTGEVAKEGAKWVPSSAVSSACSSAPHSWRSRGSVP